MLNNLHNLTYFNYIATDNKNRHQTIKFIKFQLYACPYMDLALKTHRGALTCILAAIYSLSWNPQASKAQWENREISWGSEVLGDLQNHTKFDIWAFHSSHLHYFTNLTIVCTISIYHRYLSQFLNLSPQLSPLT